MIQRLFNAGLRMGSLGTKLLLTLYMGRYLGLDEMGTYGLVAAYVAIAIPLLGMRIDYSISREIVGNKPMLLACKMREQALFYLSNYAGLAVLVLLGLSLHYKGLDPQIAAYALVLAILESLATMTSGNLVSLRRPVLANILFFIRSAAWAVPVIGLGFFWPSLRTAEFVFNFWIFGVLSSLLVTAFVWRNLPWGKVMERPINYAWVKRHVRISFFIWLGAVGAAAAGNVDRFVVDHFLGRDFVGIASFYGSFVVAISSLIYSGVFAFGFPHLVALHREGKQAAFTRETWKMTGQATIAASFMALLIGLLVPWLGQQFGRPEFTTNAPTLWLILLGIWLRSVSESIYYVMYARHQDRPIWIGNILQLVVALGSSALLVPIFGFIGIGYSAVLTAIFVCIWRMFFLFRFIPARRPS